MKQINTVTAFLCTLSVILIAVFVPCSAVIIKNAQTEGTQEAAEPLYVLARGVDADSRQSELAALVTDGARADFPHGILEELKPAFSVNGDTCGRLNVVGTPLDTVVLQGEDNERYLRYDFFGEYTYFGNAYLDYRCPRDGSLAKNTIIYGHTTRSGFEAFSSLQRYKSPEYFIEHPVIEYSTLYETYRFKIFAVIISTADRSEDNNYFDYIYPYMTDKNCVGYLKQLGERSLYSTGVEVSERDKFLTLSTCCYDYGALDTRLAVVGRLMAEGESGSVEASLVRENPNFRRPSKWYADRGIENPYADSEPWYPSARD